MTEMIKDTGRAQYTDPRSGITVGGDPGFVGRMKQRLETYEERQAAWVKYLRSCGVKAAHPDDGWVDREANEFVLCYPDFYDSPRVGDLVALGDHEEARLVEIVGHRPGTFLEHAGHFKFKPVGT